MGSWSSPACVVGPSNRRSSIPPPCILFNLKTGVVMGLSGPTQQSWPVMSASIDRRNFAAEGISTRSLVSSLSKSFSFGLRLEHTGPHSHHEECWGTRSPHQFHVVSEEPPQATIVNASREDLTDSPHKRAHHLPQTWDPMRCC